MAVRAATPADEDAVWPLARALATSSVPAREAFARSFAAIVADPGAALLVAVDDDGARRVVGYVHVLVHPAFHANGNVAWVEELFVAESHRGTGRGARLMEAAESWARREGDAAYVAVATRRAAGFYDAIGYAESATYFKKELAP